MILADKKDYKHGYQKHLAAYQYLNKSNNTMQSRCLLLVYSVECGLKCLLLKQWREDNPKEILADKNDRRHPIITSHNLQIRTVHKAWVSSGEYHQVCRYGVKITEDDKMRQYEQVLNDIIEWIREEMVR